MVAAVFAKVTEQPVLAGVDGDVVLGAGNSATALTTVRHTAAFGASGSSANTVAAVYGFNNSSYSGPGPGAGGFGVYGLSARGHGLVAWSRAEARTAAHFHGV
jgi:hypothetical protein